MASDAWNPRFEAYSRAHGRAPADQLAHDREHWSGGSMCGFILWSRERIGEAYKAIPHAFVIGGGLADHEAYDAWLSARVDELLRAPL
jgi:hypothetical protein